MLSAAINRKSVYEIHMGWMIQKFKDGWEYGPALDIEAKLHPWLIDLSELDESVLRKNLLFLKIVQTLVPIEVDPSVAAQWAAVETYWDEVFTVKFHREIGEP